MMFRSRTATIRPSSRLATTSTFGPDALDDRRPDEHGVHRLVAEQRHHELRLERVELAPERVALDGDVEQRQDRLLVAGDLLRQHDHPGAGPEQRRAGLGEVEDRLAQAPAVDEPAHRRALAARDDQAVDVVEIRGQAHLDGLHADGAQGRDMLGEGPLEGQDPDLHRRLAGSTSRGRRAAPGRGWPPSRARASARPGPSRPPR